MVAAKDISRWQGAWTDTGEPIYMVKISGGDAGLYIDPDAATNYQKTVNAGKAFGGYHFAGGTDPIAEANYYLNAMKPWNPGEVPALDWEVKHVDPVNWCLQFVTHVHDVAGAWPLLYINKATHDAYDWSPVLNNCGLWLADWTGDPNSEVNVGGHGYVMLQYSDGPNYDHDTWEFDLETFKKYGWPAPVVPVPPAPTPEPAPAPDPTPTPETPTPEPQPEPTPPVTPAPTPEPQPDVPTPAPAPVQDSGQTVPSATTVTIKTNWLARFFQWLVRFWHES